MKQVQLRPVAKETGFIDGEILEQLRQFGFSRIADQQAIIGVERIDVAFFQPAQQAVLQEMRAPLVEMHAAFLINEGLQ